MKWAKRVESVEETVRRLLAQERRDTAQRIRNAAPGQSVYGSEGGEARDTVNDFAKELARYMEEAE